MLIGSALALAPIASAHGQVTAPAAAPTPAAATAAATPAVPPAPSPAALAPFKNASAIAASQLPIIAAFVNGQFAVLAANEASGAKSARDALETAAIGTPSAPPTPPTPASPAYQAAYATAVAAAAPKAMAAVDPRARINAATAVERIALHAPHAALTPLVLAALTDANEGVQIHGLKAAKSLYPALLGASPKQADALASAVIGVLRAHGTQADLSGEPIAEEVFATLAGDQVTGAAAAATYKVAIPNLLKLLHARGDLYRAAVAGTDTTYPPRPDLEGAPLVFLAVGQWATLTKPQQALAGRAMFEFASETARLAPLTPPRPPGTVGGVYQNELLALTAGSLQAIGVAAGKTPGAAALVSSAQASAKSANANGLPLLAGQLPTVQTDLTAAGLFGPLLPPDAAPAPTNATPKPATATPAAKPATAPPAGVKPTVTPTKPSTAPVAPKTGGGGTPAKPAAAPAAAKAPGGATLNK